MVSNFRSSFTDVIPVDDVDAPTSEQLTEEVLLTFLREASTLPGRGPSATAIMLVNQCRRLERHEHIPIMPKTLHRYSLTPVTAYRALEQLQSADLITVHRKRGRGPTVTLVTTKSSPTSDQEEQDDV